MQLVFGLPVVSVEPANLFPVNSGCFILALIAEATFLPGVWLTRSQCRRSLSSQRPYCLLQDAIPCPLQSARLSPSPASDLHGPDGELSPPACFESCFVLHQLELVLLIIFLAIGSRPRNAKIFMRKFAKGILIGWQRL